MASILMIDDDTFFIRMVGGFLASEGHDVATAENAIDGKRMALELRPDLIIIDVNMPLEDGIAATARMRRQGLSVPVIIFSGTTSDAITAQALAAGANAVLGKPFELPALGELVRSLLS